MRFASHKAGYESRRKSVARTDGIAHGCGDSRLHDGMVRRHKECALGPARHHDEVEPNSREQGAQRDLGIGIHHDVPSGGNFRKLIIAEF